MVSKQKHFDKSAMKEELLEDYMTYQGNFVVEGFFPDLSKTLFLSRKGAPNKAHAPALHAGGSQVENIRDHFWGKSQDPDPG